MNNQRHHIIQFVCILLVLWAIMLQGFTKAVKMTPLKGYTDEKEKVEMNFKTYLDGSYQDYLTEHAKRNTGFREFFIRNYNQVCYSCFNKITNNNVVKGRNQELYLKMYLDEITGKRLLYYFSDIEQAKAKAREDVEATLRLIDTLHSHGTDFLFVFAPTKTAVYPEYMPRKYQATVSDFSLQAYYLQLFKENNIPLIDFLSYFQSIKNEFPYPLYTRTGTHWAESTIPMVADSIYRKLEEVTGYRLPSIYYIDPNPTSDYSVQDGELEDQMNLLFPLRKPALPRPVFTLKDTIGTDRPNLLVIGDSYFVQLRISSFVNAFNHWDYWVYNRDVQSSRKAYNWKQLANLIDAPKVLEDADIVLAIFTAPCFYPFMYDFQKSALDLYRRLNDTEEDIIQMKMQQIKDNQRWYDAVVKQAEERGLSVEENLRRNAIYVIKSERKKQTDTE